jgi:tripeptide aminopeptidase
MIGMKNKNIFLARHGLQLGDIKGLFCGDLYNAGKLLMGAGQMLKEIGNEINDEMYISFLHEVAETINSPGRGMLIDPVGGDLPLTDFDPYIRGVVRWMNELGIFTIGSCDGHSRGSAKVNLKKYPTGKQIVLLKAAVSLRLRIEGKNITFLYHKDEQSLLLDIAENLYLVLKNPHYLVNLQANHFKGNLIELLNIPGVSTDERAFRLRLRNKLSSLIDHSFM